MMARREDMPSLTGLRGIAACSVLFAHSVETAFSYEPVAAPLFFRIAWFGMHCFLS
jgi:peptidoglycan/LPS O-acetylase OafA/YrhL